MRTIITEYVTSKINKSESGRELKSMIKQIEKDLRGAVRMICPASNLNVLRTYGLTHDHDYERIYPGNDGELKIAWGIRDSYKLKIVFKKPITTHYSVHGNDLTLLNIINDSDELLKLCNLAWKLNDSLTCEIRDTVSAYMARAEHFRTKKTLLAAYPDMKKFIPKLEKPEIIETPASESKIKRFEESV